MIGFGVDLVAMAQAIKGINDTVATLNEFAPLGGHFTTTSADFALFCPSSDECGDDVLGDAFAEFFDRWQWGMRHLVNEGKELVSALTDTKSVYEEAEDKAKQAIQFLIGDPHATTDPANQSWEEFAKPYTEMPSVGKEWDKATKGAEDAWNSSMKDFKSVGDWVMKVGDLR